MVFAFAIPDPLPLNVVSMGGAAMQVAFFYFRPEIIWCSVMWSGTQVLMNGTAVYRILRRRRRPPATTFGERQLFAARAGGGVFSKRAEGCFLGARLPQRASRGLSSTRIRLGAR